MVSWCLCVLNAGCASIVRLRRWQASIGASSIDERLIL